MNTPKLKEKSMKLLYKSAVDETVLEKLLLCVPITLLKFVPTEIF